MTQQATRSAAKNFSDEDIEHWGEVYQQNRLFDHGIQFVVFLHYPEDIMAALKERGFAPLLPRQQEVQQRMDERHQPARERRMDMAVQLRGDHLMEPMHHTTHPKRSSTATFRAAL